jgi:hypothetical protein
MNQCSTPGDPFYQTLYVVSVCFIGPYDRALGELHPIQYVDIANDAQYKWREPNLSPGNILVSGTDCGRRLAEDT